MASKKYVKLDPREHVLARPGMYIGSLESDDVHTWVFENDEMILRKISYNSGLYKIYDEILVNVLDHVIRCLDTEKPVKEIKVSILDDDTIEVYNSGMGIEIEKHATHEIYIPELIFGNMLTSTNYDDTEERTIGGQNGIGAKACNIYSSSFIVETVDSKRKLLYKQEFTNNMSNKTEPSITKYTRAPYTKITFKPDYARFNMMKLSIDMRSMMHKRVFDMCAITQADTKVFFNGVKIDCKNFENYVNLYIGAKSERPRIITNDNTGRWEVCVSTSDSGFQQISFVNGIYTMKGGKHVEYITNQITKKLSEMIHKKKKVTVKHHVIKEYLFIIIKCTINNPTFDSQTKETLTTPYSKFGSKFEIDDKVIDKLYKMDIVTKLIEISNTNDTKDAKKTDGKKRSTIRGIPKLDDANWAGTSKSNLCTLILTEGDSAKTMAISGLSEIGRDKYGVFPLKGKIMNVKDTNVKRVNDNEEIANLKKIIGLEVNKEYKTLEDLRYGSIMVLTDADSDGSHIKGLLFNLFHSLWPSLMKIDRFITSMLTPIIKTTKGKQSHSFFNLTDYDNWKSEHDEGKGWDIKYYKGLGTSTNKEAKEYFKEMKTVDYKWTEEKSNEAIELAFNKKRSDDRKDWLYSYDKQLILKYDVNHKNTTINYEDFINKELIHFSNYNVERSIPSVCDGLKRSLRKILYCCLKRNLYKEIKVSQLAGYVSEHGAYHHGEASLLDAIIGMAQTFVGSNNINLLSPNGQFGTRIMGGKDSASPRYIHTELNKIVPYIYHPDDMDVLEYTYEDGHKIEPTYYLPILPMILVNGTTGIGTGFSTNIPCYNPQDIISNIRLMMDGKEMNTIEPWYRGFKGSNKNGVSKGSYKIISKTKIEITELPIGYWTDDFKTHIEEYMEKHPKILKEYESHYNEHDVKFILHFTSAEVLSTMQVMDETKGATKLELDFKLHSSRPLNTNNMHLYTPCGSIKKYATVNEIITDFYHARIDLYHKRKDMKLKKLSNEITYIDAKIKFILDIVDKKLEINNAKKSEIVEYLETNEFPKVDNHYDYLLKLPIYSLTKEKIEEYKNEGEMKHATLKELEETTVQNLWSNDLTALSTQLSKFI